MAIVGDAWHRVLLYLGVRTDGRRPPRPTVGEIIFFALVALGCGAAAVLTGSEVVRIFAAASGLLAVSRLVQRVRYRESA